MKRVLFFGMLAAMLVISTGPAQAVSFDDGGAALQAVLDGITQGGPSSVDVNGDMIGDANDSYWALLSSGGSVDTVVVAMTLAGTHSVLGSFGVYDAADSTSMVQLFDQSAPAGDTVLFGLTADGSVKINTVDTGIDFAGNAFGYYLTVGIIGQGGYTLFSDSVLNSGDDVMAAYYGEGDTVQIPNLLAGTWSPAEIVMAWEIGDLNPDGGDYTDFVVMAESIETAVPEPASLALLGLGLVGLVARRSRKRC